MLIVVYALLFFPDHFLKNILSEWYIYECSSYGLHPYLLRPVVLTDIQTVGLNYFCFFQRKIAIYCEFLGYFVGDFFSSFCFVETALYELFWESKVLKCIKLLIIYQYIKSTKTHGFFCQYQHRHLPNPFYHPTLTCCAPHLQNFVY